MEQGAGGRCGWRAALGRTGHLYANVSSPSKPASAWPAGGLSTQQLSVYMGLCATARLCGCWGCPAPAPRPWQMAGLGSNMEACLNVAEPANGHLLFLPGSGSCREGISSRCPTTHAPGKYFLRAYYVALHQSEGGQRKPGKELLKTARYKMGEGGGEKSLHSWGLRTWCPPRAPPCPAPQPVEPTPCLAPHAHTVCAAGGPRPECFLPVSLCCLKPQLRGLGPGLQTKAGKAVSRVHLPLGGKSLSPLQRPGVTDLVGNTVPQDA